MNTKKLADYFINHSPNFFKDIELKNIDKKHAEIIKYAYESIKKMRRLLKIILGTGNISLIWAHLRNLILILLAGKVG